MRRLGVAPKQLDIERNTPAVNDWFQTNTDRWNTYTGASNPTVAESPENQPFFYYNTTLSEFRIWVNIAGVMKKSAAFT